MSEPFVEEPEELEPLEEPEQEFSTDESVLSVPCVAAAVRNYAGSTFPCCILDASLELVWRNRAFAESLPEVQQGNSNLVTYFSGAFDDERKAGLYAGVRSPDSGYSWRGEIQLSERDKPKFIANLLIGPLVPSASDRDTPPGAYLALVDDISEHHRGLVRNTFYSLLEASLLKDNDTGHHVKRVNEYCRLLSEQLADGSEHEEIDFQFIDTISFVAAMHDVGKIGTPDDILNKDGPLEEWEWEVMREHTINGAYILNTYPDPMAKQIALFHHEWWDGTGYPYELAGDMIPLSARIVALADVYDALRMKRSYKPAFSHHESCEEIAKGEGTHFDPTLLSVFFDHGEAMRDIYERLQDPEDT